MSLFRRSAKPQHHHPRRERRRCLHRGGLRFEALEDRRLLSLSPPVLPPQYALYDFNSPLTGSSAADPLDIARQYLTAQASRLGLTAEDVAHSIVTDRYHDAASGTTHLYLRQEFNGLEVDAANFVVNVSADGRVLSVAGGFVPGLYAAAAAGVDAAAASTLSAVDALHAIAGPLELTAGGSDQATGSPTVVASVAADTADRATLLVDQSLSLDGIPARLHYVPRAAGGVSLAWDFVVRTTDGQHWYDTSADASSGALLNTYDWVDRATYRVVARPAEDPNDGGQTLVTDPADTVASPYGWHDDNGVAGAEYSDTRGNNVLAQEDADHNDIGGLRPNGTALLSFTPTMNPTAAPAVSRDAAIVNLFYWNNLCHDIFYEYGFTEEAGNFQTTNYGHGSGAGDAVRADALDGGSVNNANFSTPPDGSYPRMEMYLFNYTTPNRDSDFDTKIIVHEYGHGVSNRLVGGKSNTSVLDAVQSAGLGEGWSDWFSLMFTQKALDTKTGSYPVGTYVKGQPATGAGIRRYPYSTDLAADPLTFGDIAAHSEAHEAGEVWCSVLWDLNWKLIDRYGFSANIEAGYTAGAAGNVLAMQLIMDSLKLLPANPTFVDARDAILQADLTLTGGVNQAAIWSVFARRGMGYGASDGGSANAVNVVEAFDLPQMRVTGQSLSGTVTAVPASIDLTFSEDIDQSRFSIADDVASFVGPGGTDLRSKLTASFPTANTLRLSLATPYAQGPYSFTIGPGIDAAHLGGPMDQNLNGTPNETPGDQYSGTFRYDVTLIQRVGTVPAEGGVLTVGATTTPLQVYFNEAYNPTTIGIDDLTLSQGTVASITLVDAITVQYNLSGLTPEQSLTVMMPDGAIGDLYGSTGLGFATTYRLDQTSRGFPALAARNPLGGLVYENTASGAIDYAADTDSYTLALDAGQTLSVRAEAAGGLQAALSVFAPGGTLLGSAVAPATGQPVVLQTLPVATAGTYTVTVGSAGGTTGGYTLQADLNAALNGSGLTTTLPLDGSYFAWTQGGRWAVAATSTPVVAPGSAAADVDSFTLDLSDKIGRRLDVVVAGRTGTSFAGEQLQLLGPDGVTVLATGGAGAANYDLGIRGFLVSNAGVYTVRLTSATTQGDYVLIVTENLAFDTEGNDSIAAAQSLAGERGVLGYLSDTADAGDYYSVALAVGDILVMRTQTPADGALEFLNTLDPKIEVYNAGGTMVASNDNSADGHNAALTYTATVAGTYAVRVLAVASSGAYVLYASPNSAVVARKVFSNNSAFDGRNPSANTTDDAAIFATKSVLLPGHAATAAQVVNSTKGINGVMVDIAMLPPGLPSAADVSFRVGTSGNLSTWTTPTVSPTVTVRRGVGVGGADRLELIWPDGALVNTWLEVTVKANSHTRLAAPDVFYVGNCAGDVSNDGSVDSFDAYAAYRRQGQTVTAPSVYDVDASGVINLTDVGAVLDRTATLPTLRLICIPNVDGTMSWSNLGVGPSAPVLDDQTYADYNQWVSTRTAAAALTSDTAAATADASRSNQLLAYDAALATWASWPSGEAWFAGESEAVKALARVGRTPRV